MILIPVMLVLARRRLDALKVFCMFAGALTLAEIGKKLINEHRPPVSLWAMKADSGGSYPSGHATTAAVLAVALIVAETANAARDAAELIDVDYEPLPGVVSTEAALGPDAPRVWEDCPDNICFVHEVGDKAAVDKPATKAAN